MKEKLVELLKKADRYEFETTKKSGVYDSEAGWGYIADSLIANDVTVQKWNPISDPPKEKGCYLISVTHWRDGKVVTREANWNGTRWLSCYRREDITPRITHWMPLPEPPKGE